MANKIWVGTDSGNEGDWATAANWSPSGVPETGDNVYLENSTQGVTEGWAQSAVTLASLNIAQSFTGYVGDADNYLAISATLMSIGHHYGPGSPSGSGRIKINVGSVQTTIDIYNSGSPATTTKPAIQILGTHASNAARIRKGSVGIAWDTTEVSTFASIIGSFVSNQDSDLALFVGSGVTLTTITLTGGDTTLRCAATTLNVNGADLVTDGSGAIVTANIADGNFESNSTGTITNLNVTDEGVADFTKSAAARTVTTPKVSGGGKIKANPAVMIFTNQIAREDAIGNIEYKAA
jgi:trimeric autotransporter adhesin